MREDVYFFLGAYQAATVAATGRFALGKYTDQHQLCGIMFRAVSLYSCTTGSAHRCATPASSGERTRRISRTTVGLY